VVEVVDVGDWVSFQVQPFQVLEGVQRPK
jgi:hypothetical protein